MAIEITPETTAPQEPAPAVEIKTGQPDVYVEGEPLPAGVLPSAKEAAPDAAAAPRQEAAALAPAPGDPAQKAIESILEAGVGEAFGALEPLAQQAFLARGQEAAVAVRGFLTAPKFDAKAVKGTADTVRSWLSLLPDVSPAWLEQQMWATVENLTEVRGS